MARSPTSVRRSWIPLVLLGMLGGAVPAAAVDTAPTRALDAAISAAENDLREGKLAAAETRYRAALAEGWMLLGSLAVVEGRSVEARDAFRAASVSAADDGPALRSLALVLLQTGDAPGAVSTLEPLARRSPGDAALRRLLAQALVSAGRPQDAVRELEDARARAPRDLELAFALASAYLGAQKADLAAALLARIAAERPIPQTHVLIGRTYRDFGQYERARAELHAALKQDPRVRRAHYYLAMVAFKERGRAGVDEVIQELRAELAIAPGDPLSSLELGVALVESQRATEALPLLELAARAQAPAWRTLSYLGRAQLGADRPQDAADTLARALDLASGQAAGRPVLLALQLQLGQALQRAGRAEEAAAHIAESQRLSAQGADLEREQLARYLADASEPDEGGSARGPGLPLLETSGLQRLSPAERAAVRASVTAALARAYLNLGILQAQRERFAPAAELFERAAALDPAFPQVQSSLGVAYFNARRFDKAAEALSRARAAGASDPALTRMLAMASLETHDYARAADLLRDDPERARNPSLQFALGLALVKSGHAAQAEPIFNQLLAQNAASPELSVLLGQAHAQQGDFDAATRELQRALQLKPDVPEANAALGVIYLRQGRLPEAEAALRAELAVSPDDLRSRQNLAIVLEAQQRPDEALPLLRTVLEKDPDLADARYLVGKILLAQGALAEAVLSLEAAARLSPEDAGIHYQLGQAYQKLGRAEQAQEQFEVFRQLKEKKK